MWSTGIADLGMTSMEASPEVCSDPPEESCSDAGCPVHGWDGEDDYEDEEEE